MPALGIDIGGTSVKAAAVEAHSHAITLGHSRTYRRPDTATLLSAIKEAAANAGDSFDSVGLCLPGSWDESRGLVTYSINVPGVVNIPPAELVRNASIRAARVSCFTDAHAAAYGAYSAERCAGRFLAISIGTGVGAAVLDDGELLVVTGRSSGHMGQWDVTVDEPAASPPIAPDGGRGGLEGYISISALRARYGDDADVTSIGPDDAPVRALARAIRIAHALYRPNHVRLLGGIGTRLTHVLPALRGHVENKLTSLAMPGWTLACGNSDHVAAVGAALLGRGAS
ncbi:MAG: ROK family protein [Planctomycetes bacterium]|nr:ROK family protein [Planctomycetota bacterium]